MDTPLTQNKSSKGLERLLYAYLTFFAFALVLFSQLIFAKENSPVLVNWGSDEGIERFNGSINTDFFRLANHFESQNNKIYCGVASSVIVLNALRVRNGDKQGEKPLADSVLSKEDRQHIPIIFSPYFERYTQDNVFTEGAKSKMQILGQPVKAKGSDKEKKDVGLQLAQLQELLQSHDLNVVKKVAGEEHPLEEFRKDVKQNLAKKDDYILVNYSRKSLGQKGGGHISPIGAYDEKTDSVLVMDVNSNKADWVWVSMKVLFNAMATFDTVENRGYLLISEK